VGFHYRHDPPDPGNLGHVLLGRTCSSKPTIPDYYR
jgi:hypothetical protein